MVDCEVVERLTRFTVKVKIDGEERLALLRNTGRLHDLIYRGALGICLNARSQRKVAFILIGIKVDDERSALIDTRLQAEAFERAVTLNLIPWLDGWIIDRREVLIQGSRIDYSISSNGRRGLLELKSAVRFDGYYAKYPDCPTLRGLKHIRLLRMMRKDGYRTIVAFIAAHPHAQAFKPDVDSDPHVAKELSRAYEEGVEVYAVKMHLVKDGSIILLNPNLPIEI
ncbi:MAG: DNA/RNA nuclease SfsA [Nitrososphaerota archaeon]|nr:DNA/RNA nuclease SfsA [Nitrososphaerota archaeon]